MGRGLQILAFAFWFLTQSPNLYAATLVVEGDVFTEAFFNSGGRFADCSTTCTANFVSSGSVQKFDPANGILNSVGVELALTGDWNIDYRTFNGFNGTFNWSYSGDFGSLAFAEATINSAVGSLNTPASDAGSQSLTGPRGPAVDVSSVDVTQSLATTLTGAILTEFIGTDALLINGSINYTLFPTEFGPLITVLRTTTPLGINGTVRLTYDFIAPVPLPAALPLLIGGLGLLGLLGWRRKRKAAA